MSGEYAPVVVPMTVREAELVLPMTLGTRIRPEGPAIPVYDGTYDVTPLPATEILLETAGRRMEEDVTVREIPYYETTNEAGGYTVSIG